MFISLSLFNVLQSRTIVTVVRQQEVVCNLSNGAISNDLERPLAQVSRARHYSTLTVTETVEDRDIHKNKANYFLT